MFTRWTRLLEEVRKAREHDPGKKPERKAQNDDNTRTKSRKNQK